jgi:hypothetical protein
MNYSPQSASPNGTNNKCGKGVPSNVKLLYLFLEEFINLTTQKKFYEETKCKTNLYRKHNFKCMRIMGI